jgi:hypothetical protein
MQYYRSVSKAMVLSSKDHSQEKPVSVLVGCTCVAWLDAAQEATAYLLCCWWHLHAFRPHVRCGASSILSAHTHARCTEHVDPQRTRCCG